MRKALIATEDSRFAHHSGVDFQATLRVLRTFGSGGGGSTLSQQLAKNLFKLRQDEKYKCNVSFKPMKMFAVKVKEWTTAARLEKAYTKKEIMTMYLNTVDFGRNAVGIHSASKVFFNKHPRDLTIQEAAVLVGKLKATYTYDPISNPEKAFNRKNTVLSQMTKYGNDNGEPFLSPKEFLTLKKDSIKLNLSKENYSTGFAPYFRAELKKQLRFIPELNEYNVDIDGLKIYTSIDSRLQKYAEESVHNHMKNLQADFRKDWKGKTPWNNKLLNRLVKQTFEYKQLKKIYGESSDSLKIMLKKRKKVAVFTYDGPKEMNLSIIEQVQYRLWFLRCGFVSVDPHTGFVKAWVGGINHKFFGYDHVNQGARQVGSTFKPIVYSTAINNGYSMCDEMLDSKVTIMVNGKPWSPRAEKPTGKNQTLAWALANSRNHFAAKLCQKVGVERVIEHARDMGITSELDQSLSLALGVSNITLLEMVSAYCTFVAKGTYRTPVLIEKIVDKSGKVIYSYENDTRLKQKKVMPEKNAFIMVSMLRKGSEVGTSASLRWKYKLLRNGNQLGGKTGTTQNSADGLFIGISKHLVSGAWVGGETPGIHFRSGRIGQGSKMALPIFAEYMKKAYKDPKTNIKKGIFPVPASIEPNDIICDKTKLENINGNEPSNTIVLPNHTIDDED